LSIISHSFIILNRTIASNLVIITIFIIKKQFNCHESIIYPFHLDRDSDDVDNGIHSCSRFLSFEIMYTASQLFLFPILKNRKTEEIIQIFSAFSS
jgi:hypothetical protein